MTRRKSNNGSTHGRSAFDPTGREPNGRRSDETTSHNPASVQTGTCRTAVRGSRPFLSGKTQRDRRTTDYIKFYIIRGRTVVSRWYEIVWRYIFTDLPSYEYPSEKTTAGIQTRIVILLIIIGTFRPVCGRSCRTTTSTIT